MDYFRSLGNVLRGRNSHWNRENNEGWSALWSRAETLDPPGDGVIKAILFASWLFVDSVLGPRKTLDIGVDCLDVDRNQFVKLHEAFMDYAVGVYCKSRPAMREAMFVLYEGFCSKDPMRVPVIMAALASDCDAEEGAKRANNQLCGLVANVLKMAPSDPSFRYQVGAAGAIAAKACFERIERMIAA